MLYNNRVMCFHVCFGALHEESCQTRWKDGPEQKTDQEHEEEKAFVQKRETETSRQTRKNAEEERKRRNQKTNEKTPEANPPSDGSNLLALLFFDLARYFI